MGVRAALPAPCSPRTTAAMAGHAVTIGEALAQARQRAGLSVAQVSQKTRIREAIIRDIERDDYSASARTSTPEDTSGPWLVPSASTPRCSSGSTTRPAAELPRSGGTVAGEFRRGRGNRPAEEFGPDGFAAPEESGAPGDFGPEEYGPGGSGAPGELGPEEPVGSPRRRRSRRVGSPRRTIWKPARSPRCRRAGRGSRAGWRLGRVRGAEEFGAPEETTAPEEITAPNRVVRTSQMATFDDMMASRPAPAAERTAPQRSRPARPAAAGRPGGPDRIVVAAVALALAIFGGLAYLLVAGTGSAPQAGAAAATGRAAQRQAASGRRHQGATNSPAATHPSTPPVTVTPVRAVAFGPGGPPHGDDPQDAALAIDRSPRTAWQTDWYVTSHFGNLKAGTGLLLAMGHRVTITRARITLGARPGADLQLRVGDSATLAGLRPLASAANARGTIRLQLARPAHARYVLIWFTQLPLDPAGTYQVKVYNVRLR